MTRALADGEARARIRDDLEATLVVEAAAGTGKTSALVGRLIGLIQRGTTTLARIVAVTFTEKAAGEMKLRLRAEIERARQVAEPAERARFDQALSELEEAHVGTIHGFCAELLRQHPIEARVDPLFEAADGDEQARIFDTAFERWFERAVADPPEGVRRVLRRRSRDRDQQGPREALRRAGLDLVGQRDFEAPWQRPVYDRAASIDRVLVLLEELARLAPLAAEKLDWCAQSIAKIASFVDELSRREAVRGRDYDGLEQELSGLAKQKWWGWKGRGTWYTKDISRDAVLSQRAATKQALDACIATFDADLAARLREDLRPLVASYDAYLAGSGKLDFLDLLVRTRGLVRDDASVRRELQERFTHVLVDEFQDTDPLQAEILVLLAASDPLETRYETATVVPGKLFVVGDPKQAIYRFRRADVTLYERVKRQLLSQGGALVHLTTSFRSAPSLQAAINTAFGAVMRATADGSQAEYVPLSPYRTDPVGRPTLLALPVPHPYGKYEKITKYAIDESLPDAVGAFVDWLISKSGWTVSEREHPDRQIPIQARHVCLLSRRFQGFGEDLMRPYLRALEARRVPHVLVGGRSFHSREEVVAVRNVLTAIEWPEDELAVYATLRGPFLALTDAALLAFRHQSGSLHPLRRVENEALTPLTRPVRDALLILEKLHAGRNRRPIADSLAELLELTRAHAGIAIWPTGEQALANVLRVLDLARRFEAAGATSFRAFVEWLEDESERGAASEAPVIEDGTDGVRIMTVHRAKGLEFPVVIFIDPTQSPPEEPSRYVDPSRGLFVTRLAGCTPMDRSASPTSRRRELVTCSSSRSSATSA
jgi:ATP-dependent exoDNAse (exonuclease V) beta subunit